jgi:molybdopterin-binding protein
VVIEVKRDTVAATVELLAGPFRILALVTREAVDEMGLEPGSRAIATVKATNVMLEADE